MKTITLRFIRPASLFAAMLLAALAGCTNVERSRDWANPDVPGKVLVQQVCSTCHGLDGQSVNTLFPKLAGQTQEYIEGQLEAIRARDRNAEHTRQFMWGVARVLTEKQIQEIAAYFSSQPPMRADIVSAPMAALGEKIYYQGKPSEGLKSCASCHGDAAQGDGVVPRLAGQHRYYLISRARIAMYQNVYQLSDEEIAAVSGYLESIGVGGVAPAKLPESGVAVADVNIPKQPPAPSVFDNQGDAKNCHYSVWTYGWYCGSFFDALVYSLKNQ